MTEETLGQQSSVDLAYAYVRPSYEWAQSRMDVVENRIGAIQTVAVTLIVAIPAYLGLKPIGVGSHTFTSPAFQAAVGAFVVLTICGLLGRGIGSLILVSPQGLLEKLDYPERDFKKDLIRWAGEHFEENRKLVNRKGLAFTLMAWLLIVEILSLLNWIGLSL